MRFSGTPCAFAILCSALACDTFAWRADAGSTINTHQLGNSTIRASHWRRLMESEQQQQGTSTFAAEFEYSYSQCRKKFMEFKSKGRVNNIATAYEHVHNKCRGRPLLFSLTGMFLGMHTSANGQDVEVHVFDCGSHKSNFSVNDVSIYARAVGPAIVSPTPFRRTAGLSSLRTSAGDGVFIEQTLSTLLLKFRMHEPGDYTIEVKSRWVCDAPLDGQPPAPWCQFEGKAKRVYLGGSEARKRTNKYVPRLIPECEELSSVHGSPTTLAIDANMPQYTMLPLLVNSEESIEGWPCVSKEVTERGQWINLKEVGNRTRVCTGDPASLHVSCCDEQKRIEYDKPLETILPPARRTRQWLYQPPHSRLHLFTPPEIRSCMERTQLLNAAAGASTSQHHIFVVGDSQTRSLFGALARTAGMSSVNAAYLEKIKNALNSKKGKLKTLPIGAAQGGTPMRISYAREWFEHGEAHWDSIAQLTGLFDGRVSVFIYNYGFAHSSGTKVAEFAEWWARAVKRAGARPPPIKFYLSSVALQGQRAQGWSTNRFMLTDRSAREQLKPLGFAVLEAQGPTHAVGVDTTGEGGADGFHYSLQPTMITIAMIFWNSICNTPFKASDPASVSAWYAAGGKLEPC